jgi:4-amino-4-deoxy-L-arabinose transferase-like glycosyltransferase
MNLTLIKQKLALPTILLFILLLAAGLRIYHLSYKSISIDEAIGAFYAVESLPRVIILTINDVHPPLFYLIHHFWVGAFGMSEAALRSISVLFALLSILALYKLGELVISRRVGLIAAFLLAISPWHIWISQNARSNSMLLFLILGSIYSFFMVLESGKKKWFAVYACITIVALYTHYFAFMVWLAQNLYVFLSTFARRRIFQNWWHAQIVIFAGYLLWLPFMISQFMTKSRPMYKELSPKFIKNLFDFLNPYAAAQNSWISWIGEALFFLLLIWGIYRLYKETGKAAASRIGNDSPIRLLPAKFLGVFLFVVPLLTMIAAAYFDAPRALPLLEENIGRNDPLVFAETIKPYHLKQLSSLPPAFYLAGIMGFSLLFIMLGSEYLSRKLYAASAKVGEYFSSSKASQNYSFSKLEFLSAHLVLPILFAGILSLKSPYLLIRNMVIAIPSYFLLISVAITSMKRVGVKAAFLIAALLLAGCSLAQFEEWNLKDDWRSAATIAKKSVHEGDIVLLDHLFGKKPFYYYGVQAAKPIKRTEARHFLETVPRDLWLLVSYRSKWSIRDSLDSQFEKVAEWAFPGNTNADDLPTIDGKIHLIHYQRKNGMSSLQAYVAPVNPMTPLGKYPNPVLHEDLSSKSFVRGLGKGKHLSK